MLTPPPSCPARSRSGPARAAEIANTARHAARPLAYAMLPVFQCAARFIRARRGSVQDDPLRTLRPYGLLRQHKDAIAANVVQRFADDGHPRFNVHAPKIRHERPLLTSVDLRRLIGKHRAQRGGIALQCRVRHVASVRALVIITPTQPLAPTMTMRIATCAYYLERRGNP